MLQLKAEVEIRLFNLFFVERKRDSGFDEKSAGCGISVQKERECGMRTPLPDPLL